MSVCRAELQDGRTVYDCHRSSARYGVPCDGCPDTLPPTRAFDGSLYCPECGGRMCDPEPWHAHDPPLACDTCEYESDGPSPLVAWTPGT